MTLRSQPSSVCPAGPPETARLVDQILKIQFFGGLRRAKGQICCEPQPERTAQLSYLFKNLIGLIIRQFHNFTLRSLPFCSLESITWGKCKNMLLNLGNVAKMLPVKSGSACSPTLVPGPAQLIFSGITRAKITMT